MTLGGLALAVGILVDDATVEIENINRNVAKGKEIEHAILDGAAQIAVPAFVSTISICIVFVPMFFLTGVAKYLFVPLAEAVASPCWPRTSCRAPWCRPWPSICCQEHDDEAHERQAQSRNPLVRFQLASSTASTLRVGYHRVLELCLEHSQQSSWSVSSSWRWALQRCSIRTLARTSSRRSTPAVQDPCTRPHRHAHRGHCAGFAIEIDRTFREVIPKDELVTIIDNIGLPYSGINTTYSNSAPIGPADADIQVSLAENHHPTADYVQKFRAKLHAPLPGRDRSTSCRSTWSRRF